MDRDEILNLALGCRLDDGSIDIVQLASTAGVEVYESQENEDYSAEIIHIPEKGKFEILVNTNLSLHQQRFAIAHELAHFFLHKDKIKIYGSLKKAADLSDPKYFPDLEKEADEFGEELLMPERCIHIDFPDVFNQQNKISFHRIHEIAVKFKVSVLITATRLRRFRSDIPYISNSYS